MYTLITEICFVEHTLTNHLDASSLFFWRP